MISVFYQKNENTELFKALEENGISAPQNYIPIYKNFFSFSSQNYNKCNLNHFYHIKSIKSLDNSNKYECIVANSNNERKKKTFFKFSPLLDPVKYLGGKYVLTPSQQKILPTLENNLCHKKVLDANNAAYVDSFFSYLSSEVLHHHNILHCLDFFGSFLGVKSEFSINIFDDLDYLSESNFFSKNCNTLFKINNEDFSDYWGNSTRSNFKKISIKSDLNKEEILATQNISELSFGEVFEKKGGIESQQTGDLSNNLVFECSIKRKIKQFSNSKLSSSTCSSKSSHTSNERSESEDDLDDPCSGDEDNLNERNAEEERSDKDTDSAYSDDSNDGDDVIEAILFDFPIQIICLECMDQTLDSCLEEGLEFDDEEWRACLFQIIITLVIYQKLFHFTHNDLHTNNIMFQKTDKKYLYYKYDGSYYKVPTFGRLFKIIDFGRAIYKYKGKTICSDSYHSDGDAATQYNCEPYFNNKKPRLEPNMSFDLCRLGCSLFDYFIDDLDQKNKIMNPIAKLIVQWCTDDKGRNILYKTNGDERYPDFKLYKMIARTVHHCIPETQIKNVLFQKYITSRKKIKRKTKVMNIDTLPSYIE